MTDAVSLLPYAIGCAAGWLAVELAGARHAAKPPLLLRFFLGAGLGLGISAWLGFLTLLVFGRYSLAAVLAFHILLIAGLALFLRQASLRKTGPTTFRPPTPFAVFALALLLIAMIPAWRQALYYPQGGWDAWAVWNFKARFLLLAGDHWRSLFSPALWRSSPHYPLLLPLINVWAWSFSHGASPVVPRWTSLLFTFLTAGVLWAALQRRTSSRLTLLAPLLLLSNHFVIELAVSQYADLLIAFFLLAAFVCLDEALHRDSHGYAVLAALFLGMLSFTKPEGAVAAALIAALSVPVLLRRREKQWTAAAVFYGVLIAAALPSLIFYATLSPGNQTFIDGLVSAGHPITSLRLKMILAFSWVELLSRKWNGLWLLIPMGVLLARMRLLRDRRWMAGAFLLVYLVVVGAYYAVNTYFKIAWWLQVSLHRILFSLLPLVIYWVFASVLAHHERAPIEENDS